MLGAVWFAATILASWNDAHGLVVNEEEARAEIGAILSGAGIQVLWSDSESGRAVYSLPVVVVVTPSEPSGVGWHLSPSAMGVYLSTAESSAVFVFYRRVTRVLGVASGRDGLLTPSDRKRPAKAIGRVAVHELVHRVAPDLPHAECGVMRGDLGRSFLTRREASLDDGSKTAILDALRANALSYLSRGRRTE